MQPKKVTANVNERPSDLRNTKRALSIMDTHLSAFKFAFVIIYQHSSPLSRHSFSSTAVRNGQFIRASTITATKRGLIRCPDNSFNATADKANNICKSLLFALSVRVSVARAEMLMHKCSHVHTGYRFPVSPAPPRIRMDVDD